MVSFHLRKGRMFSRRAEEQAMATAQIGVPRDASFIRSGAPEAHAHRAMTNSLPDEDLMFKCGKVSERCWVCCSIATRVRCSTSIAGLPAIEQRARTWYRTS